MAERARNEERKTERREREREKLNSSRGKRRAPATSSLTAVNGRSLRRNTVRERGRENKRLRQMDGDSDEGDGKRDRKKEGG